MRLISFVFRLFTWVIIGLLAWDVYYYGPAKSVAINASITLAQRVSEASKSIPELMQAGIAKVNQFLQKHDDVASASIFPFIYKAPAIPQRLSDDAAWAIELASHRTGISRDYLVTTAYMEANFDPNAHSRTSSAAGMYQFIDSTWLSLMRAHGHDYGWAGFASQIACTPTGQCKYKGPDGAEKVMDLRYDSMTATFLSAELARSNKNDMEAALGRKVDDAELYLAHFLGSVGAIKLIQTKDESPRVTAVSLFPQAADANRGLFYRTRHNAYTCGEFYANWHDRWETGFRAVAATAKAQTTDQTQDKDATPLS